jgi:hypothetical protein
MKNQFNTGDTVYIPKLDPKADTIWTIERINNGNVTLWHPLENMVQVSIDDIAESPF